MLKKLLELIISVGKWFFNPARIRKIEEREIENSYEKQKAEINEAIAGEKNINVITDDILGDFDSDATIDGDIGLPDSKESSGDNRIGHEDSGDRQRLLPSQQDALPETVVEDCEVREEIKI